MSVQRAPIAFPKSETDLGWLAGFLEGEGSFGLIGRPPTDLRYPRISASQKQREPLERLVRIVGGTIYRSRRGSSSRVDSGIWTWCLDGTHARAIMELLLPHMSPRRRTQIDASLAGEVRRPSRGEQNVKARLTADQVLAIRASDRSQRELAREYGVDPSTINHITRGRTWRHLL